MSNIVRKDNWTILEAARKLKRARERVARAQADVRLWKLRLQEAAHGRGESLIPGATAERLARGVPPSPGRSLEPE